MNWLTTFSRIKLLPRRLSVQLSLLVSLLISATLVAHGWFTAAEQTARQTRSAHAHAAALADSVAAASLPLLLVDDLASLEVQLLHYATPAGVRQIQVSAPNGRLWSMVASDDAGQPYPVYTQAQLDVHRADRQRLVSLADGDVAAWSPVRSGETLMGWVNLTYSLAEVRAIRLQVLRNAVLAAVVAILVNLALLLLYLHRPLRAIQLAADFSATLNTRRGSELAVNSETEEVGQLQRALNFASQQLRQEHRALEESRERLQAIVTYTAEGILTLNSQGLIETCNPAAERIFGRSLAEVKGLPIETLIPLWRSALPGERRETTGRRPQGEQFPIELTLTEMWVGPERLAVATVRDRTESEQLEQLSARLGRIFEHSSNEIFIFDSETLRFVQVSEGALANLGYSMEELRAMTPIDIKPDMTLERFSALIQPLRDHTEDMVSFETVHRRKDGSLYMVEVRLQLSRTESPPVFVAIIQDITARKHAEAQLVRLANYDTLTDLPNRTLLTQRLQAAFSEVERNERLIAVLFMDLDRFKGINDTLGHDAGDELLKIVARRLSDAVRPGDTVARYGGDEFVVVLTNVAHVDDVTRVASKILGRIAPAITIAGRELFVTPSIGITLYPFDDLTANDLLRNADSAMFQAKEQGGNTFCFYTAELNARAERRLTLETSLRHALDRGEFLLHYQPQVDLLTGEILAAEALIRWQHPDWGLVSPAEFISLAEETGLIIPIGQWVLNEASTQARAWHDAGYSHLRVSVNLSGRQLNEKGLVEHIRQALDRHVLTHGALELEITESLLMQDLEQTADTLTALSELGVRIAMDDFGTGYSSLAYLKRLPIDSLKIDQSFVRDITSDPNDAAIVQAIIAMAHSLGIEVIAEGVETAPQLAFLRQRACDQIQGYYFSRPLPADELTRLLHSGQRLILPPTSDSGEYTLLVVDDDTQVRKAVVRALRLAGYRILLANGPSQAFELLAQHPVQVVLSEQRMPGDMRGSEFLARVRDLYPLTVRLLFTEQADLETVSEAVNRGAILKFMTKPWDNDQLRDTIEAAFRKAAEQQPAPAPVNAPHAARRRSQQRG